MAEPKTLAAGSTEQVNPDAPPESATNRDSLRSQRATLTASVEALTSQFINVSRKEQNAEKRAVVMNNLREELKTVFELIRICDEMESLLNDDRPITVISNHAEGDAAQMLVSTEGKSIQGGNSAKGPVAWQFGGHLGDSAVAKVWPNMVNHINAHKDTSSEFTQQFGRGVRLSRYSDSTYGTK